MSPYGTGNGADVKTQRVLFYDDAPTYGGHEAATLSMISHLLGEHQWEICFIYSPANMRLEAELQCLRASFPGLRLVTFPYTSGRLQFLRSRLAFGALRRLRALIRSLHPQCLVIVQGEISLSSLGLLAGVQEDVLTISYIPIAYSRLQRGERLLPRLKDRFLNRYYTLPHRFMTISDTMRIMLRARGAKQPIDVVENGVDFSKLRIREKDQARVNIGIPPSGFVAGLCGRIEIETKGHDVLLRALEDRLNEFSDCTFLVVGDGPDKQRLKLMVERRGLSKIIRFREWQEDMSFVYSALDLLVLPSRYEGVPLTVLEAMYSRVPIVASSIDTIAELLPAEWLFPIGDSGALADTILQLRSRDNTSCVEANHQLVLRRFSADRQREAFAHILSECLEDLSQRRGR